MFVIHMKSHVECGMLIHMSNHEILPETITVKCGWCDNNHIASRVEGFYAGTTFNGRGPFYNVHCDTIDANRGVTIEHESVVS